MSKWTEIRDGMVSALDVSDVVESAKDQLITDLTGDGMDALSAVADKFITQVQVQAESEQGWCMVRDKFVLPLMINGILWAVKLVLAKSTPATATQPEAPTGDSQQ